MAEQWTLKEFKEFQRTGKKPGEESVKIKKTYNKNRINDKVITQLFGSTRVNIKPISVNDAWKGRRFKSDEYVEFEHSVLSILPDIQIPNPPYVIYLKFGMSSYSSDWDNCIKTTQDVISKKYQFNDKHIRKGIVETELVSKGQEYFEFKIESL